MPGRCCPVHRAEQESEMRTFIKGIQSYVTIEELGETVLNLLISQIRMGEVKKVDSQRI